ncbi:MAG: hypothetical protein AABY00_01845 [Nanoarchaeota archaeon]
MPFSPIQDIPIRHVLAENSVRDVVMNYALRLRVNTNQNLREAYLDVEALLAKREVRTATVRGIYTIEVRDGHAFQLIAREGRGKGRKDYYMPVGKSSFRFLLDQYGVERNEDLLDQYIAVYIAGEHTSPLFAFRRGLFAPLGMAFVKPCEPLRLKKSRAQVRPHIEVLEPTTVKELKSQLGGWDEYYGF